MIIDDRHSRTWDRADLAALADSSLRTIVALQAESGAYPASPTFSAYRGYSWFRDGAFIADGVSAYGGPESATLFFDWCSRIVVSRQARITEIVAAQAAGAQVPDSGMLATRYTLAGDEGDDDWWDFQLDGYGTWLWALSAHADRHGLPLDRWGMAVELTVDYLVSSWHRSCFDWWEERPTDVHVSTLCCISAGLHAAANSGILDPDRRRQAEDAVTRISALIRERGVLDGHLVKSLDSTEVDASLLSAVHPFGVFPPSDPIGAATIAAIDEQLNVGGGVHRYLADTFYGGGQWPVLSCLLGLAQIAAGDVDSALAQLKWAANTTTSGMQMPEQVDGHLLAPPRKQEWIDRWGTVATPLLWSHAMYLRLAAELSIGKAAS